MSSPLRILDEHRIDVLEAHRLRTLLRLARAADADRPQTSPDSRPKTPTSREGDHA